MAVGVEGGGSLIAETGNHFWARSHFTVAVFLVLIFCIDMPPGRLVGAIIIIFIPTEVRSLHMYKRANGNGFCLCQILAMCVVGNGTTRLDG